jgi:hypothetical protein
MSHPGVMDQERSYALLLNQHDKAFCRIQTVNGTIRRGVNTVRMTSIPSIDASALRLAQLVTVEQTGDHSDSCSGMSPSSAPVNSFQRASTGGRDCCVADHHVTLLPEAHGPIHLFILRLSSFVPLIPRQSRGSPAVTQPAGGSE